MTWPRFEIWRIFVATALVGGSIQIARMHEAGQLGSIVLLSAAIGIIFKRPMGAVIVGMVLAFYYFIILFRARY